MNSTTWPLEVRNERMATMRLLLAVVILIGAHFAVEAGCQGTSFNFCSKTFYATAPCDGQDQLASIARNNCPRGPKTCMQCESGENCPLIEAWEPTAITIVGVEITVLGGRSALQYAYAGNGYHPNQMAFLGAGESHTRNFFPAGTGFKLPPAGTPGYINLHVSCLPTVADAGAGMVYAVLHGPKRDPRRAEGLDCIDPGWTLHQVRDSSHPVLLSSATPLFRRMQRRSQ